MVWKGEIMLVAMASFTNEDERWDAVMRRDNAADGAFYYSVRTTGVYCRPSCASRPARRENVGFHLTCADAERAGFRPCKRCKPNEAGLAEQHAAAVAKACRLMDRADDAPNLEALAAAAGMSRFHFHRVFRAVTGVTPKAYADARRSQRVREELSHSRTVTEAIYGAGFNSSGRFYEKSAEILGMTPTDFRAGGHRAAIRFAAGSCSLGTVLVAATDKGVCAILLGDDAGTLVCELKERFPRAELVGGDREFERTVAQVVSFVESPRMGLDLPLDVRGTAFQQRVWQALCAIPEGSRASYREIAERIGAPKSVRAVAQACAANTLAVAIPCHRVVRRDGGISGYRWGVERKRTLLEREAAVSLSER
jgi:AraC family transcriptional regulator, regulatory protein of adaptative response / methylated-DNA-[protein]-cysteine methyltransferase